MMKPGVLGTGIYEMRQAGLLDAPQPLEERVGDEVEDQRCPDRDESVDRIIDELHFIHPANIGKISPVRESFDSFLLP
jgi:hypothetical protein